LTGPPIGAGQQDAGEHPALPPLTWGIREPRLEDDADVAEEIGVLGVGKPHGCRAVAHSIAKEIWLTGREVVIEVGEQAGDERRERPGVVCRGHRRDLTHPDLCCHDPQGVGALDRTADAPLGNNLKNPSLGETRDVAVEAPSWYVIELRGELGGGESSVAQKRLDDPQPHRVQEKVCAGHAGKTSRLFTHLLPFPEVGTQPSGFFRLSRRRRVETEPR
jgi:hypothetical protein